MWKHPACIDHRTVSLPWGKPGKSRKTERGSYPAIPNFFCSEMGCLFCGDGDPIWWGRYPSLYIFESHGCVYIYIIIYIYNYITNKRWWKIVFLVSQKKGDVQATQWDLPRTLWLRILTYFDIFWHTLNLGFSWIRILFSDVNTQQSPRYHQVQREVWDMYWHDMGLNMLYHVIYHPNIPSYG